MIWPFSWFQNRQDRCLHELLELKDEIAKIGVRILQVHQAVAGVSLASDQKWVPDSHYGHVETVSGQRPEPSERVRELTKRSIDIQSQITNKSR